MPDIGDSAIATLTVTPFGPSTTAALSVAAPDGTTTAPTATTADSGATWTATVSYTMAGWWLLTWTVTGTGAGKEFQRVFVPTTSTAGGPPVYATLEQLKTAIAGNTVAGVNALADRDPALQQALLGASRGIDAYCGRRFYRDTAVVARTVNPRHRVVCTDDGDVLLLDDIATITALVVETGSSTAGWTALTAYETYPDTALYDGWPITGLLARPGVWNRAQYGRVRITATWGWPSIPDIVVQAALMQAARLYKRKDSPEGVSGSADWGLVRVPNMDPDVRALLSTLVVPAVG
jgi:hypothetical protein